jgi:hypothetical protein
MCDFRKSVGYFRPILIKTGMCHKMLLKHPHIKSLMRTRLMALELFHAYTQA